MDAVAYQVSFDKEQLALLCANYDRRIDSLGAENERLKDENAKLRELVRIAGTYCVNGLCGKDDGCPLYLGKPYCDFERRMRELGVTS